jgi:hypothetical protein
MKDEFIYDDEPDRPLNDPLNPNRIHFWILIKQNSSLGVSKNIFVDPFNNLIFETT